MYLFLTLIVGVYPVVFPFLLIQSFIHLPDSFWLSVVLIAPAVAIGMAAMLRRLLRTQPAHQVVIAFNSWIIALTIALSFLVRGNTSF